MKFIFIITALLLAFTISCNKINSDEIILECESDLDLLDNSITIKFNNGSEPEIDNPYENNIAIIWKGEHIIVNNLSAGEEYNLIISGTTENGSLKIYGNRRMGLYLNNANITNPSGPAINIQNRQRITVHLVSGTQNYIADGTNYEELVNSEDAKGTFFSEGQIHFSGCGSLWITGRRAHAIVVDNDIEIENGKITVAEAVKDGIHANGEIDIKGGILKIASAGDAIQSEDMPVRIFGGRIAIITAGVNSHGIKANNDMEISDGTIDIKASGEGSKGIRVRGNLTVKGGDVKIKANDDGIKVHGDLSVRGGNVCAWSLNKQHIDCNGIEMIATDKVNGSKCANGF